MSIATPQRPTLLGLNGQPISAKPPEMMTAVKFIRKMAEDAGGIGTASGQALHRLAAHFIRLQEELERTAQLHDLRGDHTPEMVEAAAQGVYMVVQARMEAASGVRPDDWTVVVAERPEEAEMYRLMASAALGAPCYHPVMSDDDR